MRACFSDTIYKDGYADANAKARTATDPISGCCLLMAVATRDTTVVIVWLMVGISFLSSCVMGTSNRTTSKESAVLRFAFLLGWLSP